MPRSHGKTPSVFYKKGFIRTIRGNKNYKAVC